MATSASYCRKLMEGKLVLTDGGSYRSVAKNGRVDLFTLCTKPAIANL